MKAEDILMLFEHFEQAATTINDVECWSARSLCAVLGYADWRNFVKAIDKAKESCSNAGEQESDHFVDANKMINERNYVKPRVAYLRLFMSMVWMIRDLRLCAQKVMLHCLEWRQKT